MKSTHSIFVLAILGILISSPSLLAQKSTAESKAEEAKKAQEKVEEAAKKIKEIAADLDCPAPKNSDKQKIKNEVVKAKAELDKAKAAAKAAWEAATKASDKQKPDAKAAAETADEAFKAAEKALKEALKAVPGIPAADRLKDELDKADVSDHSEKKKMRDQLKDAAEQAGFDNPCDSIMVKKTVEQKLDELMKKYEKSNSALYDWLKELKDNLKDKALISLLPSGDSGTYLASGTHPAGGEFIPVRVPEVVIEVSGGIDFNSGKGADYQAGNLLQGVQQRIYSDPAIFENLFEKLGGEFFIGTFSHPGFVDNVEQQNGLSLGFGGRVSNGGRLFAEGSLSRSSSNVNATFPVMVTGQPTEKPHTILGELTYRQMDYRFRLGGGGYLGNGIVRPFGGGGVQYASSAITDTQGRIAEVAIPVEMGSSNHALGAYVTGGIEVNLGAGLIIRANVFAGSRRVTTGDQQKITICSPGISLSAGWQF